MAQPHPQGTGSIWNVNSWHWYILNKDSQPTILKGTKELH